MKSLRKRVDFFTIFCIFIAFIVLLFIGGCIGCVVFHGISQFFYALFSKEIRFAFKLSLFTSTISTFIVFFLSMPTAYALTKTNMPLKGILSILLELTLSLPFLLLGLSLLILFSSPFGKSLQTLGIQVVFTPLGIIMAHIIVNLPYSIRLIKTAFSSVTYRMEYVSKTLGASRFQFFYTVLLPMCKNSLISTFILTWARAVGEFGATLMVVGITRFKTETLPGSIYLSISTGDNNLAMATAMIMLCISAAALFIASVFSDTHANERLERNEL